MSEPFLITVTATASAARTGRLQTAHGARVASLSTSPIAIGIPRRSGPLLLDIKVCLMTIPVVVHGTNAY